MFGKLHRLHKCNDDGCSMEKEIAKHIKMAVGYAGASDEQKERIHERLEKLHEGLPGLKTEANGVHEKVFAAIESGNTAELDGMKATIRETVGKGISLHLEALKVILEELTAEQRGKLVDLIKN